MEQKEGENLLIPPFLLSLLASFFFLFAACQESQRTAAKRKKKEARRERRKGGINKFSWCVRNQGLLLKGFCYIYRLKADNQESQRIYVLQTAEKKEVEGNKRGQKGREGGGSKS